MRTSPLAAIARSTSAVSVGSPKPRQKLAMSAAGEAALTPLAPALTKPASSGVAGRW
jgi:hypothetical protein